MIKKSLKDLGLEYIRSPCETKNQIIIIKEKTRIIEVEIPIIVKEK